MPSDVPSRGRKAFASLFSTLRVKTFRGLSSGLPRNSLSLSFSFSLFLSLSLSLSLHLSKYFPTNFASNVSLFLLFRRCLLPCYLMSIIRTLSSLAASFSKRYSRYISTLMKFHWSSGLKSSDCKQRLYAVQSIRLENIDTNKLRKVDSTYES